MRPGDTLLGIALDFGLTVADLKVANPTIDPLALQVGQQLIIPEAGIAVAAVSTPIGLTLDPPSCHDLITGSTLCLGKIVNTQSEAIRQPRVQVGLLDAQGQLVAEATAGIEQTGIPPNGIAPYSVIIKSRPYTSTSAVLLGAEFGPLPQDLIVLAVLDEVVQKADRHYRVQATIQNRSTTATGPLRLVLTLFDQEGQVTGFRVLNSPAGLEAGASQHLEIEALAQTGSDPVSHFLYAEARRSS